MCIKKNNKVITFAHLITYFESTGSRVYLSSTAHMLDRTKDTGDQAIVRFF